MNLRVEHETFTFDVMKYDLLIQYFIVFENPIKLIFQVHAYIISSLKKDMPSVFGKEGKKKELIKNLDGL